MDVNNLKKGEQTIADLMLRLAKGLLECIGVRGPTDPLGVSETLKTLQVASEGLLVEAAQPCMEYLEAIPWSDDQTLQIKKLISSLQQIEINPNLSARLYACQAQYLKVMEIELKQMLFSLCAMRGTSESLETTCYEILVVNCGENCSKQLKDLTKSLVLQEARNMLRMSTCGSSYKEYESAKILLWFIRTLRGMGVTEYVSVLGDAFGAPKVIDATSITKNEFLNFLNDAFKKMASGQMIIHRKDRLKLVTNCMPIIQQLRGDFKQKNGVLYICLQRGIQSAISTLPAEDYMQISKTWDRNWKDLYSTSEYCYWMEKLRSGCNSV